MVHVRHLSTTLLVSAISTVAALPGRTHANVARAAGSTYMNGAQFALAGVDGYCLGNYADDGQIFSNKNTQQCDAVNIFTLVNGILTDLTTQSTCGGTQAGNVNQFQCDNAAQIFGLSGFANNVLTFESNGAVSSAFWACGPDAEGGYNYYSPKPPTGEVNNCQSIAIHLVEKAACKQCPNYTPPPTTTAPPTTSSTSSSTKTRPPITSTTSSSKTRPPVTTSSSSSSKSSSSTSSSKSSSSSSSTTSKSSRPPVTTKSSTSSQSSSSTTSTTSSSSLTSSSSISSSSGTSLRGQNMSTTSTSMSTPGTSSQTTSTISSSLTTISTTSTGLTTISTTATATTIKATTLTVYTSTIVTITSTTQSTQYITVTGPSPYTSTIVITSTSVYTTHTPTTILTTITQTLPVPTQPPQQPGTPTVTILITTSTPKTVVVTTTAPPTTVYAETCPPSISTVTVNNGDTCPPANTVTVTACPTATSATTCSTTSTLYPYLLVPVASSTPDKSFGSVYTPTIDSNTSLLAQFGIPDNGLSTCSLEFHLPGSGANPGSGTSAYQLTGTGSLAVNAIGRITSATTYNQVSISSSLGQFALVEGQVATLPSTFPCSTAAQIAFELVSNRQSITFFEDYNLPAVGLVLVQTC